MSPKTLRVYEPFSVRDDRYALAGLALNWHEYAPGLDQVESLQAYARVLEGKTHKVFRRKQPQRYLPFMRRNKRMIIKDPIACFSAEWLAQHFDMGVLVMVRHPAAYVASLKRLIWNFNFQNLLRQEQLMSDWLEPFREEMERSNMDIIDSSSLFWKVMNTVLIGFAERNPEWRVCTNEDRSLEPAMCFRGLFDHFSLEWTPRVAAKIAEYSNRNNPVDPEEGVAHSMRRSSAENIDRWRKLLSPEESLRVREITKSVAGRFYDRDSW